MHKLLCCINLYLVKANQVDLDAISGAKSGIRGMSTAFNLEIRKEHVMFSKVGSLTNNGTYSEFNTSFCNDFDLV